MTKIISLIRELVDNLKCVFSEHVVSKEDQEYVKLRPRHISTMCIRCKYPLIVWGDPKNDSYYYVKEEF